MTLPEKRDIVLKIAWAFLGVNYKWAGDDPMAGFDCSGFIVMLLQSVGILPYKGDWSAEALWQLFKAKETNAPHAGVLVFWGSETPTPRMTHIEICIDDEHCIGASGGGSKTLTLTDAINQNAYIRIKPVSYRSRVKGFADPFV